MVNVDLSSNQISDLSPVKSKSYTKLAVTTQAITAAEESLLFALPTELRKELKARGLPFDAKVRGDGGAHLR